MYAIEFTEMARIDFQWFRKHEQNIIADAILQRLRHEPMQENRNRKRLCANSAAAWALRIGQYRVFYDKVFHSQRYLLNSDWLIQQKSQSVQHPPLETVKPHKYAKPRTPNTTCRHRQNPGELGRWGCRPRLTQAVEPHVIAPLQPFPTCNLAIF